MVVFIIRSVLNKERLRTLCAFSPCLSQCVLSAVYRVYTGCHLAMYYRCLICRCSLSVFLSVEASVLRSG